MLQGKLQEKALLLLGVDCIDSANGSASFECGYLIIDVDWHTLFSFLPTMKAQSATSSPLSSLSYFEHRLKKSVSIILGTSCTLAMTVSGVNMTS